MPMDNKFLIIWSGDSSKEINRTRSLRLQPLNAKHEARMVFAVPADPVNSILLPLYTPLLLNNLSNAGKPVEIISEEVLCANCKEVIGTSEIPLWSIRKGYSLVPC